MENYSKENWGAAFIVTFMILLITAAVFLALENEVIANRIAVYAYYFLVIGVVLQIASYLKYGRKDEERTQENYGEFNNR